VRVELLEGDKKLETESRTRKEIGRFGHYGNVVFWAVIVLGIIYWAIRMGVIEGVGVLWSAGLAAILITINLLNDRANPPRNEAAPVGVAMLTGIVVGYLLIFMRLTPISSSLVETMFGSFWPLALGWATSVLVRAVHFSIVHGD